MHMHWCFLALKKKRKTLWVLVTYYIEQTVLGGAKWRVVVVVKYLE